MADSPAIHRAATWILIALALITFVVVSRVTAPYGRHQSERVSWGPTMPARLGWIVMESPAVLVFAWIYLQGVDRFATVPLILLGLWQFHYVQRTYVFPFRMRNQGKRMPVLICGAALVFQVLNSYVNARWISQWGGYDPAWLGDPRLWVGGAVFLGGWMINFKADSMLFALRKPGEGGYQIPRGWLYEYVSCPNYLGEILVWCGWAIATWSLAGLAFALYTVANVGPRALAHHRWYQREFEDYPRQRKALIPFVL